MCLDPIEKLTLKQMAGQRLMVGFDGTTLNADLKYLIDTLHVGALILFSCNIKSPAQLSTLCHDAQQYALETGQPPLLIAIDQEGGPVARLKAPFTEFAGNKAMTGIEDAEQFAAISSAELLGCGINMNFAPVLDVAFQPSRSIMADRAFGRYPIVCSRMGAAVIGRMQQNGVMAVAKHFPGIGRTKLDSHIDRPRLKVTLDTLRRTDLLPFETAIEHQVAGIMLAHVVYKDLDSLWPASLSPLIVIDLLRKELNYQGVVMTDDLDMGAIEKHYDLKTTLEQILLADIDFVMICHRSDKFEKAYEHLLAAKEATHHQSVERILRLKTQYLQKANAHHSAESCRPANL